MDDLQRKEDAERDKNRKQVLRERMDAKTKEKEMEKDRLRQREYRAKQLLENPDEYRYSVAQNKANSRNNQVKTE